MGSRRSRRSAATGVALRILVWAALFYALIVFAAPCALSVITDSEVERPTHTSLICWGVASPVIAGIAELLWWLLMQRNRTRSTGADHPPPDRGSGASDS